MYINVVNGREVYHAENFEQHNIELLFINGLSHSHKQFGNAFEPLLSVIAILMFEHKLDVKELLERYALGK